MKKLFTILAVVLCYCTMPVVAQVVTTTPPLLQEKSKNVVLTYHADSPQGNGGLKGLSSGTAIYAHIGVITSKSTGDSDWKYVVSDWPSVDANGNITNASKANTAKNKLTYVSANTYTLNIGDIRTYFNITDASESVKKIALVFRTADGKKEGKTNMGADILVEVLEPGFQMSLSSNVPGNVVTSATNVTFTVNTTENASITLAVNGNQIGTASATTQLVKSYNITNNGTYKVSATATAAGTTLTKELTVSYPKASTYPGGVPKMGAVKNSDGTVTFCLAAPNKSSVVLVPSWDDYQVLEKNEMSFQDYDGNRYFFITISGLSDHEYYPYYYLVDDFYKVADPYAHLVLDCYNDKYIDTNIWPEMPKFPQDKVKDVCLAVYRGDMHDYEFTDFKIPTHSNLVIYELCVRDFTGTEGQSRGNGTLRQAIQKLPYLKALGVNAVELMPVMEFDGNISWGYNTNFYMAPDKAYGSPKDLKDFVETCHRLGMAVILDIVFNHAAGLHPWYLMYPRSSNPFFNETAPHELSVFNDWKQENKLVQQQWKDCIKHWMTAYNVDGFRFDLVKGLGDSNSYGKGTGAENSTRVTNMKRIHDFIREVKADGIHINENFAPPSEEEKMGADGQLNWANTSYAAQQYTMGYAEGSAQTERFLSTKDSHSWGTTVTYAESHDEERIAYKQVAYGYGDVKTSLSVRCKRLGSLAAQLLLTPGPKMIWQFQELGADETTKSADGGNNTDPKKVIWDYLKDPDRGALHHNYEALCNLRKDNPQLFAKSATFVTTGVVENLSSPRVMRLTSAGREVMCFINPDVTGSNKTVSGTSTLLNANNCQLITASPGFNPVLTGTGTNVSVSVPPHCFAVFATKNVTGVEDEIFDDASSKVNVYGSHGCIVIEGEYSHATVYNVSGQAQSSLNVAPGMYIVNVDGTSHKVLVK